MNKTIADSYSGGDLKQKNWLPKSFLSRDATVPQPGIRVGFIPGGSTDSVSVMVTLVTMAGDLDGVDPVGGHPGDPAVLYFSVIWVST